MRAQLSLVDGEARPNVVELVPERPISIGRSRDNTVVLPLEEQASRLHARLYFESGHWLLRDFGLNGTRVDNARVNQVTPLADGNEIRIGNVRLRFVLPDGSSSPGLATGTKSERSTSSETIAASVVGPRWNSDELVAINQFMANGIEARDPTELARQAVQSIYYQTGASLVGLFALDPSNPLPRVVWPESAQPDEALARQLTRRVHRDHRTVWLAEDTAATLPNMAGAYQTNYADALAIPLKVRSKVLGAFHLCKANGHFSDRDRKFAEAVANFTAPIVRAFRHRRALEAETARLRAAVWDGDELLGDSPTMVSLRAELARVGAGHRPVLIRGEPGVGKELAAREAHRRSHRADGPFVVVRPTSTPSALLEAEVFGYRKGAFSGADKDHSGHVAMADDGTLYFDQVSELSLEFQARLMRLIETRSYRQLGGTYDSRSDVRVIAASHVDLAAEVKAGRFRSDLLNALKVAEVVVPPLRAHPEDIPHLAQFFLDRIGAEFRHEWILTPAAVAVLREKKWPGNIGQLRHVLGHAASAAECDEITDDDLRKLLGNSQR